MSSLSESAVLNVKLTGCARPPFGDLVHALMSTFTHGCDVLASSLPWCKDFPAYSIAETRKGKKF